MKKFVTFLLLIFSLALNAQQREVTGKIMDGGGFPLPGVNVIEKGTNNGVISDIEGNFKISGVTSESVLVFSFIGMTTQEQLVGNQINITVKLSEDAIGLDEVVAIGYGTRKKSDITGSIASVKSEEIALVPVSNVTQSLSGRMPGLITRQTSGEPGFDNANISIRGFGNALIIVDGVERSMSDLDPNEIETVSILKDASAAVYGARAGNGVVLVTTKRGVKSKPKLTFNTTQTWQTLTLYPEMMNAAQISELIREAQLNINTPEENMLYSAEDVRKYQDGTEPGYLGYNWWDKIVSDYAPMQQHNLSVRGGGEKVSYYMFLGYTNQQGMWKSGDNKYNRYNVRSNIDANITDNLKVSLDLSMITGDIKRPTRGMKTLLGDIRQHMPTNTTELPDPDKIPYSGSISNGLASTRFDVAGYNHSLDNNLFTTLNLEYNIPKVKGLVVKGFVNYQQFLSESKRWNKKFDQFTYDYDNDSYINWGSFQTQTSLNESYNRTKKLTSQFSINYDRVFNEKHTVSALALVETIDQYSKWISAGRGDYTTTSLEYLFAGGGDSQTAYGAASETSRLSYIGRINYNYDGKYLAEATVRYDGSPNFPSDKRWGLFPSISLGWRLSKENFLSDFEWLDELKIRGGASKTGFDGITPFQYLAGYRYASGVMIGGSLKTGLEPTGLANPNITWEEMTIYNAGLDYSMNGGKVYSEADVFYRDRTNVLGTRSASLPPSFGAVLPHENINALSNRGFEFLIGHRNTFGDFKYDLSANVSWTREKWEHYEEPDYSDPDDIRIKQVTGNWSNRSFGYVADGLFSSQEEIDSHPLDQDTRGNETLLPGDVKYVDQNEDGVLDWRDKVEIGYGQTPSIMFGFNMNLSYKHFDLSALIQGAAQRDLYTQVGLTNTSSNDLRIIYEKRWHEGNQDPNAEVPRQYPGGKPNNSYASTYWLKNGSYVRLKTLNINYNIPNQWLSKIGIEQARVYIGGSNLLTFSELTKWQIDPEANGVGGSYPLQKTYTLGLNLNF